MKKKLIIILILALIFGAFYLFDFIRSGKYVITVENITPDPAPADGRTPVEIKVKLTDKKGNPVYNHSLFAYSLNGGSFKSNRELTDEEGCVELVYFPYKYMEKLNELRDVQIRVIDESNSIFIEVNTEKYFDIKLVEGKDENSGPSSLDIFGED